MIIRADYKLQDCVSKEARDILTGLLEKDPSKRLTTTQILQHPWMQDAKDTVELFTQAEKNYIRTEYTYTDKSRYNRNNDTKTGLNEYDSDAFVDAMLDTNENSILKNADTKSVILAPFNSTKSHIETGSQFLEQVRDLLEDRRVIKFAPRVREVAKQYEVNNNADLDNGVQHDFLEEEAKLKVSPDFFSAVSLTLNLLNSTCVFVFSLLYRLLRTRRTRYLGRSNQASKCLTSWLNTKRACKWQSGVKIGGMGTKNHLIWSLTRMKTPT